MLADVTPDEVSLLISLISKAIAAAEEVYEASELKTLAELEVKLQAQLDATAQDREAVNTAVNARDREIADQLARAEAAKRKDET